MDRDPGTLPQVRATRYVAPLREGGSLPAICEADDLGTYVVKFRGAGQGPRALAAEVIVGHLAGVAGLRVPDLVHVDVDPQLPGAEPDPEIHELLASSVGGNLGVDYLPGALPYDPAADAIPSDLAARIVWFDAFVTNVDRSWRNPNLLIWHGDLWVIDHGAALVFAHDWSRAAAGVGRPLPRAQEHALIAVAGPLAAADDQLAPRLTDDVLRTAVAAVPDEWLTAEPGPAAAAPGPTGAEEIRAAYVDVLRARLAARHRWLPSLESARGAV